MIIDSEIEEILSSIESDANILIKHLPREPVNKPRIALAFLLSRIAKGSRQNCTNLDALIEAAELITHDSVSREEYFSVYRKFIKK